MRTVLMTCFLVGLCACTVPNEPINGQYRVTVEQVGNTCSDGTLISSGEATVLADLLPLQGGGNHRLMWVGAPEMVDYDFALAIDGDQAKTLDPAAQDVSGRVTADSLDLKLTLHRRNQATDAPCEKTLIAKGRARPMHSKESIDGRYLAAVTDLGYACNDGNGPGGGWWYMRLDVRRFRPDRDAFWLQDAGGNALRFWTWPVAADGIILRSKDVFDILRPSGGRKVEGDVEGFITPQYGEYDMSYSVVGDPRECTWHLRIAANRWLPSLKTVTNEYNGLYVETNTCRSDYQATYEAPVLVIEEHGGKLDLIDQEKDGQERGATLNFDGASLSAAFGSDPNEQITYEGRVSPEEVAYTMKHHYTMNGQPCVRQTNVSGIPRYDADNF